MAGKGDRPEELRGVRSADLQRIIQAENRNRNRNRNRNNRGNNRNGAHRRRSEERRRKSTARGKTDRGVAVLDEYDEGVCPTCCLTTCSHQCMDEENDDSE
ncbi:hypothetical protein PTSG_10444 [Salpingoeca rosetta]|uniref:Uncharacterized protein n=1 Tax=Salpingoeca rosetta (strain ATCC 50818 / BSB-021) TaxID=946362 RepID=F2UPP2_SALR5|nr:uncharacterized protein PTSG_10444 [Salpingoeca rosetta]EGD79597.1 hypothetical protein PTSG_10444 [Salpingoeca rosetta]|eukprot:XP_004988825.1 hypothetical protein PTSG_10444 [Salpingoeca rosetta]